MNSVRIWAAWALVYLTIVVFPRGRLRNEFRSSMREWKRHILRMLAEHKAQQK